MKVKILILAFVAINGFALPTFAQTSFTWNGLTSSDWTTTTNWTTNDPVQIKQPLQPLINGAFRCAVAEALA